jgi:hypothetical protein
MPDKPKFERLRADALSFGRQGLNEASLEYYLEGWECYKRSEFADMDVESFTPNPDEILERRARLHLLRALGIYDDTLIYWFLVDEVLDVWELEKKFPYDERRFLRNNEGEEVMSSCEVEDYCWKWLRRIIKEDLLSKNVDPALACFVSEHYSSEGLKKIRGLKKLAAIKHIKQKMKLWIAEE